MPRCEILLSYRRYMQNTFYTFSMCLYNDTAILKLHEGNPIHFAAVSTGKLIAALRGRFSVLIEKAQSI